MSKKNQTTSISLGTETTTILGFNSFKTQALVLIIIGFIFYTNSFFNEYALDDGIVIQKNEYVQEGLRGIPKILKKDAYESFYRQMGAKQQLSGGRYRPLSIVTFAIEEQFFGSDEKEKAATEVAFVRHVVNVLFYILSIVVLLYFLNNFIFKNNQAIGFITCLIFLIHPLHTEVVANVKSRDEILSFLFIILTFIAALSYRESKKNKHLIWGLVFYFLALLSKEYAVTLVALLPILFYIIYNDSLKNAIIKTLPFIAIAIIYVFIRLSIVGTGASIKDPDVLNSPFKFATTPEKWATRIEILNHYLKLLFYPHPLSSDYSYNSIPYTNFKNTWVWTALFIHISAIVATIVLFFRRHILAFALAFYLLHLLLVSNFLMDIGATMGERLIYHSSFGFAILIAYLAYYGLEKIKNTTTQKIIGFTLATFILGWCAIKTINRNAEWKNDTSLFIADAATVPNSALVNGNAGKAYIDILTEEKDSTREKELLNKAIYHLNKAVNIHKKYVNGYINLGVAYFKLKEYDKAKQTWDIANSIYPSNPYLKANYNLLAATYYNKAMAYGAGKPHEAIVYLEKAVAVDSLNADYWYNLGGASFTIKNFDKARIAWKKTLQLKPDYTQAKQGMAAIPLKE